MTARMDRMLDKLFQALPASSHRDIAIRMGVPTSRIGHIILHLRKHPELGWTVPPAKRGAASIDGKFFAVLCAPDEGVSDVDPGNTDSLRAGAIGTVEYMATLNSNQKNALLWYATQMPPSSRRRRLLDFSRRLNFMAEEAISLLEALEEDAASA